MKDKKGFTLIELLAVIVILAIIALIATPVIMNIINSSRENSAVESAKLIVDEAQLAYQAASTQTGGFNPTIQQVEEHFKADGVKIENHVAKDSFGNICTFTTTNEFTVTCENEKYESVSDVKSTGEMLLADSSTGNYTFVQYVESTGTQCIDTKIIPTPNTSVECEYQFTEYTSGETIIFGSYSSGWNGYKLFSYGGTLWFDYQSNDIGTGFSVDTQKHTVKTYQGIVYIDGQTKGRQASVNPSYPITTSIHLFAGKQGDRHSKTRIYSFKIRDNKDGNVLIDLVPCYKKSDGTIGMYDRINNQFYPNACSDTFVKGPDV